MRKKQRTILSKLLSFFKPDRRWLSFAAVVFVDSRSNPAAALAARKLVLIGPHEQPKWLRFQCPCGCGEIIALNLMESHYPRWTVRTESLSSITVTPSIDSSTCGSHFWITANKIIWVEDDFQSSTRDPENNESRPAPKASAVNTSNSR